MKESTVGRLDVAREKAGIPFVITSGYRCEAHNRAVGGVEMTAHTQGRAVDIKCSDGRSRAIIVKAGMQAGFTRIGVAKTFIHLDDAPDLPQNVIWTY